MLEFDVLRAVLVAAWAGTVTALMLLREVLTRAALEFVVACAVFRVAMLAVRVLTFVWAVAALALPVVA